MCVPSTILAPNLFLTRVHTAVVDGTATFVVKFANPTHFEDRIRENQRQDPKFSFLHPPPTLIMYYIDHLEEVAKGDVDDEDAPNDRRAR